MSEPLTRTADEHCTILWQWLDLIEAKVKELQEAPEGTFRDANFAKIAEASPAIRLAVMKSSYLGRRLYGGEEHRTEPCPVHQGRWSGLAFEPTPCGCDLTGWLPAGTPLTRCPRCSTEGHDSAARYCYRCGQVLAGKDGTPNG